MRNATKRATLVFLLVWASTSCAPHHIKPFTPKQRAYTPGKYAITQADAKPADGSLFSEATPGMLQDTRAIRAGDLVMITIDEQADAKGNASTATSKSNSVTSGATALLGLVPALKKAYPDMDATQLIALASQSSFSGTGDTARSGALKGVIATRVRDQMPNGDLFVEGTKVVMINHEEYHLYISGVIRPADIAPDNSILSSRVADAQVEYTGRGDVDDSTEKGWLAKIVDAINPF